MQDERVTEIRIAKRHLQIGQQFYPLSNIARIQTFWIEWGFAPIRAGQIIVTLLGILVLMLVLSALGEGAAGALILVLALLGLVGVAVYRQLMREKRVVLCIETTGPPMAVLTGRADKKVQQLFSNAAKEIVGAIENPPASEFAVSVGDVILGDKVLGDKVGRDKNVGVEGATRA
jgi:hypothetical protein